MTQHPAADAALRTKPTRSPRARQPIEHPAHRVPEARTIATEAGWHEGCPDPLCRHGRCAGALRSYAGGPRSFPTCLHIAIRMFHDRPNCTLREADAFLHFVRPGEGWTMVPMPGGTDGLFDLLVEDREATLAETLLFTMHALGAAGDLGPEES